MFRRWVHVREEDEPDARTYRPYDYPIPPGRGRDGIAFRLDGTVTRYDSGPADAPVGVTGRWSLRDDDVLQLNFPDRSLATRYRLVAVEPQRLRLAPLTR